MTKFPLLMAWDRAEAEVTDLNTALVQEIQVILKIVVSSKNPNGYYTGAIDGKAGKLTTSAIAAFKSDHWLGEPTKIGATTVKSLLEMADGVHPVSEQVLNLNQKLLPSDVIGSKTGRSMRLPNGDLVYQNQCIIPGIPLTWGEFTKNCTRIPNENRLVENTLKFARGWGEIRDKYGSPLGMTSGYRPPLVNRQCGGARYSQHIYALAGDIYPLDGNLRRLEKVIKASSAVGIGLAPCKNFYHIDFREGVRVIFGYGC